MSDLAELLKRFERRGVSLVSVADSLDTRSAAGRLVLNIMVSVSQWEREAIGECLRSCPRSRAVTRKTSSRCTIATLMIYVDEHERTQTQKTLGDLVASTLTA